MVILIYPRSSKKKISNSHKTLILVPYYKRDKIVKKRLRFLQPENSIEINYI